VGLRPDRVLESAPNVPEAVLWRESEMRAGPSGLRGRVKRKRRRAPNASIPVIGPEREAELRQRLEQAEPLSVFETMKQPRCPHCEKGTLLRVDDLQAEMANPGERIIVTHLSGFRCDRCGKPIYDGKSSRIISRLIEQNRPDGAYTATVSSLGGGRLGIYLPRDVLRNVDLRQNDELRITAVTRTRLVVQKVEA